ncbi:MAG TPA: hypothetical protein VFP92_00475 [Rhodanobacteraceae bacterium]|nr:hypothetical protein [Rhodanobacteraceae bacterium]
MGVEQCIQHLAIGRVLPGSTEQAVKVPDRIRIEVLYRRGPTPCERDKAMRRIAVIANIGCRVQADRPRDIAGALHARCLRCKLVSVGVALLLLGNQRCSEQRAIAQIRGEARKTRAMGDVIECCTQTIWSALVQLRGRLSQHSFDVLRARIGNGNCAR